MLMVYNILHVGLQPPMLLHQQLFSITRGHDLKLFKPHAQKTVRSNFFFLLELSMFGISYQMKWLLLI